MFWGDRYGLLEDSFGTRWGIATHVEDLTREEMQKRVQEATAQYAKK
jgi:PhnB protein